jgi:hypothetical protein
MVFTYNPSIYSASKIWHATKWQDLRDRLKFNIVATWIDVPCGTPENPTGAKLLTDLEKSKLWIACAIEPVMADCTIVYAEEGDEMRGALVELGSSLGANKPVFLIGDCATFRVANHSDVAFTKHPFFHRINGESYIDAYYKAVAFYNRVYLQKTRKLVYQPVAAAIAA